MPQLDIVTLFSQVFWLLSLYFLTFFIILYYYLPKFSKLFKLRFYFILRKFSPVETLNDLTCFSRVLNKVQVKLNLLLHRNTSYFLEKVNFFNLNALCVINVMFIKLYNYNLLKYNLYRKFFI